MKGLSMRERILNELAGLLHDNLGQRLTPALATGIATLMNQAIALVEGTNDSRTQEVRNSASES